jgi:hypothetical protein
MGEQMQKNVSVVMRSFMLCVSSRTGLFRLSLPRKSRGYGNGKHQSHHIWPYSDLIVHVRLNSQNVP